MKRYILLILIFFIFIATNIFADEDGGRPGYFLNQGGGARALGMGRTYVAICDDASAVMWNPAGLYQLDQKEINTMYVSLFEDTHYGFIGYAHPTSGVFSYGISALSLYSGDLVKRDSNNNPIGTFYDMNNAVLIGLSYSKTPELSVGLNAKWINKIFDDLKASGFGFDLSLLSKPFGNLTLGVNLQNILGAEINREMITDKTAFNIKSGISYRFFNDKLITAFDIDKTTNRSLKFHGGTEYLLHLKLVSFAFRAGYDQEYPTGGLGIKYKDYQIDYAMLQHELGMSHRVSMDFTFGITKEEAREISKKRKTAPAIKKEKKRKEKNELKKQIEKAKEIERKRKQTIADHLGLAREYYQKGNWDSVMQECQAVLNIDSKNSEVNQLIKRVEKKIQAEQKAKELTIKKKLTTIAVLDFKPQDVSAADATFVSEFFRQDLVMSGEITVVERSNLEQVLTEQGFQQTGCTEQDCAVQIGKMLNISSIIIGSFGRLLDTYQITIRLIDVETGKIIYADNETCYSSAKLKNATKKLADRLVEKVK